MCSLGGYPTPWTPAFYVEALEETHKKGQLDTFNTDQSAQFTFYNTERPHRTHGYRTPAEVYTPTLVEANSRGMVESLTSDPFRIAGPDLNIAPILS